MVGVTVSYRFGAPYFSVIEPQRHLQNLFVGKCGTCGHHLDYLLPPKGSTNLKKLPQTRFAKFVGDELEIGHFNLRQNLSWILSLWGGLRLRCP